MLCAIVCFTVCFWFFGYTFKAVFVFNLLMLIHTFQLYSIQFGYPVLFCVLGMMGGGFIHSNTELQSELLYLFGYINIYLSRFYRTVWKRRISKKKKIHSIIYYFVKFLKQKPQLSGPQIRARTLKIIFQPKHMLWVLKRTVSMRWLI